MTKKGLIETLEAEIKRIEAWHERIREKYPMCYQEQTDGEPDACLYVRPIYARDRKLIEHLQQMIDDLKSSDRTPAKAAAIEKATAARIERTRHKVANAIHLLQLEGKEITPWRVSRVADIGFTTAKKYLEEMLPAPEPEPNQNERKEQ